MNVICFDTEMANGCELLELSVYDLDGSEIFTRRFKPKARSWSPKIHHITPAMVRDLPGVASSREEIQRIIDSADCMIGCAIDNDLRVLRRAGIEFVDPAPTVDIQHIFWLLRGRLERTEYTQTSLEHIAQYCGVEFGEGEEHTSSGDTRVTLECFKILLHEFVAEYAPSTRRAPLATQLRYYSNILALARAEYQAEWAKGFVSLIDQGDGFYTFKFNRVVNSVNPNIRLTLPVIDRHKAETDLRRMFSRRRHHGSTGMYRLTESDIERLKAYSNDPTASTKSRRGKS
ncbi:MAG: 3'-5' exonuclease [Bacteroidales bacterium]|nr:3'-5' exonuclease [Bacteroidales bacterium]